MKTRGKKRRYYLLNKGAVTHMTQRNQVHNRPSPPEAIGPKSSSGCRSPAPSLSHLFWRSRAQCMRPWLQTVPCSTWNTESAAVSHAVRLVDRMARSHLVSPQAVIEGLHSVLGHAIRSTEWADSPEHASDVHHSASGHLDEREDAQRYVDNPTQIDRQHELVIFYGEPVAGSRWHRDSGIVHNSPQA